MNNFFVTLKFIVIIIKKDLFVKITELPKKKQQQQK